jgi:anti-sigma B factor antagonist
MLELTTRDHKRLNVIRVVGRVDAATYGELEAKLQEYMENGHVHLILEMDGTEYLSSAGARVLISTQKALKPRGGRLALAQPSERVREVLDLAGLDTLFPIYETTVAALASE